MKIQNILAGMTEEIAACLADVKEEQLQNLAARIRESDRIFVAGAGRSLLMVRGLAMRLMQLGYTSYVVGETVTPAILPGDILVVASGSGTTATLQVMAQKCKKVGARLALITTHPDSPIGELADDIVEVKAATTKDLESVRASIQPGANTFEQSVLLIGDAIVIDLINNAGLDETNEEMMKRHANLE